MASSRWTKRNNSIFLNGWVIYILCIMLPFGIVDSLGQLQNVFGLLGAIAVAIGAIVLVRRLNDGRSQVMARTLKMEYGEAEFALRMTFKDKGIQFQRQLEEASQTHSFDFRGHGLTMTLRPYDLVNGIRLDRGAGSQNYPIDKMGVLVTLHNVNATTQSFAEKLTTAIDETAVK